MLLFSDALHGQYAWNRETTHALGATSKPYAHLHTYADGTDYLYLTGHNAPNDTTAQLQVTKLDDAGVIDDIIKTNGVSADLAFGVKGGLGADGYFYAVGGQRTTASQSVDILVVKIQPSTGNVVWQSALTSRAVDKTDDLPTDFYVTHAGEVYLTGTAGVNGINPNVLTAKLNNDGSVAWLELFNRANGIDAGFVIQPADTLIRVLGATHPASGAWSVTDLRYEPSTGTLADTTFVSAGNVLFDDRIRFAAGTNRLYVTGGTSTTGKQESEALAFTSSLNTVYQQDVDLFADRTDVTALYLDKTTDGLLLAGDGAISNQHYTTFLQHRAANGTTTYSDTLKEGRYPTLLPHYLTEADSLLFLAGAAAKTEPTVVEVRDHERKRVGYLRPGLTAGATSEVTGIHRFGDKVLVAGIEIDNTGAEDFVTVYRYLKRDTSITREHDKNLYPTNEVIVNFNPRVLDTAFIDDPELNFGTVADVLTDTGLIDDMDDALNAGGNLGDWHLLKIFPWLGTDMTTQPSADGGSVYMSPLWSRLMLIPPEDVGAAITISNALRSDIPYRQIRYAHPNYLGALACTNPPNDTLFKVEQLSLDGSDVYDINACGAWDLMSGAWRDLNITLIDSGVRFGHEDLRCANCTGLAIPGTDERSVIQAVYDATEETDSVNLLDVFPVSIADEPQDEQDNFDKNNPNNPLLVDGHGTRTAGIIAAVRDNSRGIAGLLNNYSTGSGYVGANIHSYRFNSDDGSPMHDYARAIVHGAGQSTAEFIVHEVYYSKEELSDPFFLRTHNLLRDVIQQSYWAGVINLDARGNFNSSDSSYVSSFSDRWSISVGASNEEDGEQDGDDVDGVNSGWGGNMDVIAPGDPEIVRSTSAEGENEYDDFSDTSAALPHAVGVAGMIAMKHPTNLDQEDIEQLLQISATDEGIEAGYDDLNAWGRVDAQRALEMIDENHDQLQVLHYTIQGEFPKITQDASPVALELDFGFEDFCSKEDGTISGKRRKYYYDFSIDLGTLGATLATLPDTNLKPYWIRNAQSGLWGAPTSNDIRPENGAYFEGPVNYDSLTGVLSGRVAGWTIVEASAVSGACADPNNPCNGEEIPTCYFGQPPIFPLSILVETPTVIDLILVTDTDDPNAQNEIGLKVYPNPSYSGLIRYELAEPADLGDMLIVTNLSGEIVTRQILSPITTRQGQLNLSRLPPSIYFLSVLTSRGTLTRKIVLQ